jgi:RsiW-degrading membrane proteinase PrsW (M82 family)
MKEKTPWFEITSFVIFISVMLILALGLLFFIVKSYIGAYERNTENCNFIATDGGICNWYDEIYYSGCSKNFIGESIIALFIVGATVWFIISFSEFDRYRI